MAQVELETKRVSVHLNPLDEVLSLHASLHMPYSHIVSVAFDPVPTPWFQGFRIAGTNLPGVKLAGTFFNGDGVAFYDFHDPSRCLTFALEHQIYKRVVVQVDKDQDPGALADQITKRLGR
jgi:hypothetical protein